MNKSPQKQAVWYSVAYENWYFILYRFQSYCNIFFENINMRTWLNLTWRKRSVYSPPGILSEYRHMGVRIWAAFSEHGSCSDDVRNSLSFPSLVGRIYIVLPCGWTVSPQALLGLPPVYMSWAPTDDL